MLQRHSDRQLERFADLLEPHNYCAGLDRVAEFHSRKRRSVYPTIEVRVEVAFRLELECGLHVFRARLLESPRCVKTSQPAEERVIADQFAQHVQRQGALVIDEGAKHTSVVADVAESV